MAPPKQHKSYTAIFKLTVVGRAEIVGNRAAAREFKIDERNIRRWRSEKDNLEIMPLLKSARRGGVVAWPSLETKLEAWVKNQQDQGISVSTTDIRLQAQLMAQQMGISDFKGGQSWCFRFMKRKNLYKKTYTTKTTVGDSLPTEWQGKPTETQILPTEWQESTVEQNLPTDTSIKVEQDSPTDTPMEVEQNLSLDWREKKSFLDYVKNCIKQQKFDYNQVINMGEVPLFIDCPPSRTPNKTKEKYLSIVKAGNKIYFTCVLACASNGEKLKPMLIFKHETILNGNFPEDVIVRCNDKGWINGEIMIDWLNEVWCKRKNSIFQPQGLLILDSMQARLVDSIEKECKKFSITLAVIPEEMQPINLTINEAFKKEMRKHWEHWTKSEMPSFTKSGKIKKATYEAIAKWVSRSWKCVKTSSVISGFVESEIISHKNTTFFMETHLGPDSVSNNDNMNNDFINLFNSDSDDSDFEGFSTETPLEHCSNNDNNHGNSQDFINLLKSESEDSDFDGFM